MSVQDIRDLLCREPFEPFRIRLTSGTVYEVRDANSIVLMKNRLFIAFPGGEKWTFCPYLHIAAVESARNGRRSGRSKRRQ